MLVTIPKDILPRHSPNTYRYYHSSRSKAHEGNTLQTGKCWRSTTRSLSSALAKTICATGPNVVLHRYPPQVNPEELTHTHMPINCVWVTVNVSSHIYIPSAKQIVTKIFVLYRQYFVKTDFIITYLDCTS
jgi:hypothetical protein